MEFCRSALGMLILLIISTGPGSAVSVVKVKYNGTAVLPCSERCTGEAIWTFTEKSTDTLAECDQTSCRSVKDGYQIIHNQYLQGDLSLIITEADFSKSGWYTCECDERHKCEVLLQVEALETSVQIECGGSLVMKLEVSDKVKVIYNSTGSAGGSSDQICTVTRGSLQPKPEYQHRTSLSSSAALELREMRESDSGVYTVRDLMKVEDLHIYTVTVTDSPSRMSVAMLVVCAVAVIVLSVGVILLLKKNNKFSFKTSLNGPDLSHSGDQNNEKLHPEKSPLNNHEPV